MFERFTTESRQALKLSRAIAEGYGASAILAEHLLAGIALLKPPPLLLAPLAQALLSELEVAPGAAEREVTAPVPLSQAVQGLLVRASAEADTLGCGPALEDKGIGSGERRPSVQVLGLPTHSDPEYTLTWKMIPEPI
jgi:hypothetical protein